MKLGYFMMPLHDPTKDYHQALAEDTEAIILADQLGFEEAWVGEHFTSAAEPITSPLLFMATLIARTQRIKFGTGVLCLPQYHPAVVAGYAAMFDHLSEGRFIMGIGPGGLPSDFELFGVMDADRNAMMVESIDMILKIWETEPPYNITNTFWNARVEDWAVDKLGLGRMVKPFQKPHPPIALSALSPNSGTMRFAGKRNWDPISANFIGAWSVASHWRVYDDECRLHNRVAENSRWRVARSIFVAESNEEAEKFVMSPGGSFMHYYEYLFDIFERSDLKPAFVAKLGDDANELTANGMVDSFVIRGDAQTVTNQLLEFHNQVGGFGTLLMTAHDWTDKARMRQSMELMATEVMPSINKVLPTSNTD
ncbi:MAG: LLM class flavin-dependent oxidoreductase [Alphaproteobacteria bacterium]